jgi:cytoskeletal protein RodZ
MNKKMQPTKRFKLSVLKSWHIFVLAGVFLIVGVFALRQNNFTMIRLREAVTKADQDNGDVEAALQALRKHVYSHMNTDLSSGSNAIKPPIQLKARYERLASAEQERIKQANAKVTADGEAKCSAQHPGAGFNAPRVACVQEYVRTNGSSATSVPDGLYKFDFVSPSWSPDIAGWSLVISIGLFALGGATVLFNRLR